MLFEICQGGFFMGEKSFITELPACSLPRERLLLHGPKVLSNQELLAILLRTGTKEKHVMLLAAEILNVFPNLFHLKQATMPELTKISGVGLQKALLLSAAMELGARMQQASLPKLGKIQSSFGIAQLLIEELKDYRQEHLIAIYLNSKNEVIEKQTIFIGSLNQSIAHPREIFRLAVKVSAARLIIAHNHPSGNVQPSSNDLAFTKRVVHCGELIGIEVLDHIIVSAEGYFSLREEGLWEK
jgi:DNA repair protein RadC